MFTGVRLRHFRSFDDSGHLELSAVTVLIGRNNTGKSTLLRALYQVQEGAPWNDNDIRLGHSEVSVEIDYDQLDTPLFADKAMSDAWRDSRIVLTRKARNLSSAALVKTGATPDQSVQSRSFPLIPAVEPHNLIYPTLSGRRMWTSEEQVRLEATTSVLPTETNLISRASAVMASRTTDGREFQSLCKRVLGDTLDLMTAANGQRLGRAIDRRNSIGLDAMGTGVSAVIGLLVNLAGAHNRIFLIEEPENDLHPSALKALLDVIVEKSADNQFIISTHSSIVLTRLGALAATTVLQTSVGDSGMGADGLPTSTLTQIDGHEGRLKVLRDLGYALADLAMSDGWLVFEESSAERLCRQFLIPWFAPSLSRLNTAAAAGAGGVRSLVRNLHDMTLYAHLEPVYRHRLWVIIDSDDAGTTAVAKLKADFPGWPEQRFLTWPADNFESFYPREFQNRVDEALSLDHDQSRAAKRRLLEELIAWIMADESLAREQFAQSAKPVIELLRNVSTQVAELMRTQ